jgi:hypothetical protein
LKARSLQLALSIAVYTVGALAQTTAIVNIDTTQLTPLNANFSGFNYEGATSYEPYDYQFNGVAALLSPGWIRYPGGIVSDAFNWQTGLMLTSPSAPGVASFSTTTFSSTLEASIGELAGKGGHQFLDVGREAILLGAQLIVVINGYTDTPADAGALAALATANNIPVAVWELCNEPYFFESVFFASGNDYASQMKPFRDAIKAVDPNAVVALFFSDPGSQRPAWDSSVASYSPQYWDAITYHFYGAESTGTDFTRWMTDENANLYSDSASYVTSYVAPLNPAGTKFLVSEFNPTGGDLGNNPSLTDGTLYGAIYAAEYIMRMSTVPSVLHVGMHALSSTYGVNANDRHANDVQNAYNAGSSIDTATLNYGFFPSAQAQGVAILNGVLRNATHVYSTTVSGGATVAATGLSPIPALYAQAYANAAGYQSVVITNKSATAHQVTVNLDGSPAAGSLPLTFITDTDPSTTNTATTAIAIAIQSSASANPIPVPPYSVVRVDLSGGITIQTNPPGLQFTVDGGPAQTAPQFLNLSQGSHTIAVGSTLAGSAGTQYVFSGWSDGGSASHSIGVNSSPATYTASFKRQYELTTSASPSAMGSVSPASGSYFDSGALATVTGTATAPYAFSSWSGDALGTTNPVSVIMNMPHSVTGQFVNTAAACDLNRDGVVNVKDVQLMVNEALGVAQALNDVSGDGVVDVLDIQLEINAALGGACTAT